MENIVGAVGPLATNLADLSLFCDVLLSKHPWRHEPSLIPLPWTAVAPTSLPSRLKIGVIRSDNIVLPHPPVTRCMEETIQALTAAGHEIFEWDTTLHRELVECVDQMYFQDAGKEYYDIMNKGGEQPVDLLKWILERESSKNCSADETWKVCHYPCGQLPQYPAKPHTLPNPTNRNSSTQNAIVSRLSTHNSGTPATQTSYSAPATPP